MDGDPPLPSSPVTEPTVRAKDPRSPFQERICICQTISQEPCLRDCKGRRKPTSSLSTWRAGPKELNLSYLCSILWSCEGPLGIPLELVQATRASCRVEAGNSGFLSSSDRDLRVPMEIPLGSQTSSGVGAWNSPLPSRGGIGVSGLLSS